MSGKLAEPNRNAILDQRQQFRLPGFATPQKDGGFALQLRRLDGVEGRKHPRDRPRTGIVVGGQQSRMVGGDVEHDRASLEQHETAFLIGRDLPERMQRQMRGFFHRAERHEPDLVGKTRFLECPAHARVARESPAAIGRFFKGGDGDGHGAAPLQPRSSAEKRAKCQGNLQRVFSCWPWNLHRSCTGLTAS